MVSIGRGELPEMALARGSDQPAREPSGRDLAEREVERRAAHTRALRDERHGLERRLAAWRADPAAAAEALPYRDEREGRERLAARLGEDLERRLGEVDAAIEQAERAEKAAQAAVALADPTPPPSFHRRTLAVSLIP